MACTTFTLWNAEDVVGNAKEHVWVIVDATEEGLNLQSPVSNFQMKVSNIPLTIFIAVSCVIVMWPESLGCS